MTHFSGAIIWEERDGIIHLLVQEAISTHPLFKGKKTKKFPGGVGKGDETPEEILRREILEELWVGIHGPLQEPYIFGGKKHKKHFFVIHTSQLIGRMRDTEMDDEDNTLLPPRFERIDMVYRDGFLNTHQRPLVRVMRHFGLVAA